MRIFIALNLERAVRTGLHRALEPLRQRGWPVRWMAAPALHLTLRFLGDVEGADVERIESTLRVVAAKHGPQHLELGGFGAFPSLRRATVLWVGVTAAPALMALQRELDVAVSRLGYGREEKPFRPHITVARLQGGARPVDVERAIAEFDYANSVSVATMDLMRSHLEPGGAQYEALLRLSLGTPVEP
jgi:RNA 2',3'-cyclic 3'-phosphodiesterase